jgi:hypothetical protein
MYGFCNCLVLETAFKDLCDTRPQQPKKAFFAATALKKELTSNM